MNKRELNLTLKDQKHCFQNIPKIIWLLLLRPLRAGTYSVQGWVLWGAGTIWRITFDGTILTTADQSPLIKRKIN